MLPIASVGQFVVRLLNGTAASPHGKEILAAGNEEKNKTSITLLAVHPDTPITIGAMGYEYTSLPVAFSALDPRPVYTVKILSEPTPDTVSAQETGAWDHQKLK